MNLDPGYDVYAERAGEWHHLAVSETPYAPISPCALAGYDRWRAVIRGHDADGYALAEYDVDGYYPFLAAVDEDVPAGGSLDQHAIVLEWGRQRCIESSIRYVSLCGRTLRGRAERAVYQPAMTHDDPHVGKCFDCLAVGQGGTVSERRREIHF